MDNTSSLAYEEGGGCQNKKSKKKGRNPLRAGKGSMICSSFSSSSFSSSLRSMSSLCIDYHDRTRWQRLYQGTGGGGRRWYLLRLMGKRRREDGGCGTWRIGGLHILKIISHHLRTGASGDQFVRIQARQQTRETLTWTNTSQEWSSSGWVIRKWKGTDYRVPRQSMHFSRKVCTYCVIVYTYMYNVGG